MADPTRDMLRHFEYRHLPLHVQEVCAPFLALANELVLRLPPGPEKTAGMRKLLEARDCCERAARDMDSGEEPAGE